MAQAKSSSTSSSAAATTAAIVRDLSTSFVQQLTDTNLSLIRKSLECLRSFSLNPTGDGAEAIRAFKYLKDKIDQIGATDDATALVSLIVFTLIIPCYRFYSIHDVFALHFFQLFDLILSHPSVSNIENHRFSIAVITSRTSLYPPNSSFLSIDKWTTEIWLGKLIGQNPTTNKMRYQSQKPFPFAPKSQTCDVLCDNTKYPIDITNQYDLFIERARNHQHTNADELTALQNVLDQLFHYDFILQSFLNADQCLSLMLSFAVQRQRILDVQITDVTNLQAQTQLASVKNQMLNQFDYLPNVNNRDFKFIQSECKVKWTDGKEFIYSSNTIYARPSFLSPISTLLQYAYVQQQDDSDTDAKALWNLLLQTIHQIFTKYLEASSTSSELVQADLKDFFLYFLNHNDEQIRQTGTELVTIFIKNLPASMDIDLPPLISCTIVKNLFQSIIDNDKIPINQNLLDGCLQLSLNWSIDDFCSLLTFLAIKLSEISTLSLNTIDHHRRWLQFFIDIMNKNLDRLTTSTIKMNKNFIEFSRQVQTSLFMRLFHPTIENSFEILKFIIKYSEKDWIKILLEIIDQQCKSDQLQENIDQLLKECRQYAFEEWNIMNSFDLLVSLIKFNQDKNPILLLEFLLLFEKTFDVQSKQRLRLINVHFRTIIQPIMNVLHLVFSTKHTDQFLWNSTFRRRLLTCTVSITFYLIKQFNIDRSTFDPIDMQRIIQSTVLLSIDYKQMLRLFNFLLQSKQQNLIEYWFKQVLTITLLTNDNLNEEEKLTYIRSDQDQSSFYLQPSIILEFFGIYTHELIQLLHEKLDQAINFISSSTFHSLSVFIQQSLPLCIQCLLHKDANIRVSTARLVGRALNMQSDDLTKLLQSLRNEDSEDINTTISTSFNLIDDQQRIEPQVQSTPTYILDREKKRSKSQIPFRVIKRADFQVLANDLTKLSLDESSTTETNSLDKIKHLITECPEEFRHLIPNRRTLPSLVQTKTMLNNRKRIIECIRTPIHLLLQGETGVGKSSLILDVAADLQKPLIRFNLSSKTDIAGLFGSTRLKTVKSTNDHRQEIELDYEEGPFTIAYRHGHWLLLDEMNLAPSNVLQAIEQALESGVLILPNIEDDDQTDDQQNRTKENYRVYQMHPQFRLFATQNPSTGQYKGARDVQSTALLNRFSIFIVEGPKNDELTDIVANKLRNENFPFETQVQQMVKLHLQIMNLIKENDFKERNKNYAEITIRELFRWCQSLGDYEKMLKKVFQTVENLDAQTFKQIISEQAYAIYGLRFREQQSQIQIASVIENLFHLNPLSSSSKLSVEYRGNHAIAFLSQKRLLSQMPTITPERVFNDWPAHISKPSNTQEIEKVIKIHNHFFKYFHDGQITQIYDCSYALFWSLIERRYTTDMTPLPELVVEIYTSLCRDEHRRKEIVKHIATEFREPESFLSKSISPLSSARSSFYFDDEANRIAQFILSASPSQPILIVGPEGCGKSHIVQAIATLTNVRCQHLYLTPQTEPAALVGSLVPHPKLPQWHDGAVSEAITKGHWLILENFSEASSAVLERLNPVLEQPPQWVKVENNETEPVRVSPNFRIIATMSPPTGRLQNASIETNHELTPALYNRFLIINYQGLNLSSQGVYKNIFTSYFPTNDNQSINYIGQQIESKQITPRQLVQFIDCAFKLQHSNVTTKLQLDLPSVLLAAYELVFNVDSLTKMENIRKYLETHAKHRSVNFFDLTVPIDVRQRHREHIIDPHSTPTRYEAAKRLCASIICSRPVLLEGPAATGKTSLIEYLAQCNGKTLYRVNNTKGTTVQDYFGSYMPNGEFLYGALSRAMLDGHWFVADEFDLAEPAVMNILYPILEGQQHLTVPNTGQTLRARDGFRFFATQNGTSYVGRKQLPKTLRSRFLEIQFHSFTEKELEFIIIQRKLTSNISEAPQTAFYEDLKQAAPRIAATVTILNRYIEEKQRPLFGAPKLGLTMREVIKWINRKQRKADVKWEEHALRLLESRVPKKFYDEFSHCLRDERAFPELIDPQYRVKIDENQISFHCPPNLPISYSFTNSRVVADEQLSSAPQNLLLSLWRIFAAVDQHEPVLLLGPTCYKSYLIKIWSKLMTKESDLCTITCSTSTETNDLIGSIRKAKDFIQRVAPDRNQLIEIGQLDTLTKTVVDDLFNIIEQSILAHASRPNVDQTTATGNKFHPLTAFTLPNVRNVELWTHPEIVYSGQLYVNDFRRKLERQILQQQMDIDLSISSNEFIEKFDLVMEALDKSYSDLEINDTVLVHTDKILLQIEQQLEVYIGELIRTMEDYILPSYKPTQALPDTRGNRLHIPGIVKFICTQGQYNRIYLNQIGSQKPEYRIALLLDQSVSMTGPTYFSSVDILLSMCAALNKIGIEDFNVLTFGKQIELIKSYKQNYDRLFLHHLLNALKIDGETTLLSDAIFLATELLQQQSTHNNNHGPMFIFVLTDGYDKRGSFIHRIIAYAEQRSITVIGIGVGFEANGVCLAFNDWIIAQNPRLLCDAFINWSNEQGDGQTPYDSYHADKISTIRGEDNRAYSSTDDVWNEEMKTHFDAITQNAKRTIDLTFSSAVHNSPLTVEICFVMDCTGSMGSWIQACKQHIKAIADGIQKDMKEKYDKDSALRMAFVAYRDYNDSNRFDLIDFHQTPNLGPVEAKIASQQATGGADECEDVQGGLDKALKLNWTKDSSSRAAQILVWVGDAPGHTPFCSGGTAGDSYPGGLPDVPLMENLIQQIKNRGLFLLLSDFTANVQTMLKNIEAIYKRDNKENLVKRVKLNQADTSSLLNEVMQQVNTIIASEFM